VGEWEEGGGEIFCNSSNHQSPAVASSPFPLLTSMSCPSIGFMNLPLIWDDGTPCVELLQVYLERTPLLEEGPLCGA